MEVWNNEIHDLQIMNDVGHFTLIHSGEVIIEGGIEPVKKMYRQIIKAHDALGLTEYYKKYRWE